MAKRTNEDREYHAEKERGYRANRRAEKDAALAQFGAATTTLLRLGYTPGRLTDLIVELREDR